MSGRIDFQVAEGDFVATRWHWDYEPESVLMKVAMAGGRNPVPIINLFRFKNGKMSRSGIIDTVSTWDSRLRPSVQGFAVGVLAGAIIAIGSRLPRRWRAGRNP